MTGKVDFSILVTLVPVITLAAAFLNETMVNPYSEISANVASCDRGRAVIAMTNSGTKSGIVQGGFASFSPTNKDFDRLLLPPPPTDTRRGSDPMPVIMTSGLADVRPFSFADPAHHTPLAAPLLADTAACRYKIKLEVLEFGGAKKTVDAGECQC